MTSEENPLIRGILDDARKKADAIIGKANEEAASIISEGGKRAEKERSSAEKSYALRLEQIKLREESAKRNIDRLSELKNLDSSYKEIMAEVERRIDKRMSEPGFSDVIVDWIAEAAIGLDRKDAKVAFSVRTPVTDEILQRAEKKVLDLTGAEVNLTIDPVRISGAGVMLSSMDGKVSYNNQLGVRIRRYQRDIKRIVQEENARENSR